MRSGAPSAPRVRVVGDALLDVHVTPAGPPRPGSDVPAAVRLSPGGQGANLAVRLARAGVPTELACALGHDPAGDQLRRALADEGVTVRSVDVATTGTVVVLREPNGERTMLSQRVAFAVGAAGALPDDGACLVLSGYPLTEPDADALVAAAGSRGRAGTPLVVVGCAVADERVDTWRSRVMAMAPDVLVLNRDEADRLGAMGAARVVVVTDASGAEAHGPAGRVAVVAPRPPVPAVDTTGAGDAFAAQLVAALLDGARSAGGPSDVDGSTLEHALARAVSVATRVTQAEGAQAAVHGEHSAPEVVA